MHVADHLSTPHRAVDHGVERQIRLYLERRRAKAEKATANEPEERPTIN